MSLLAHIRPPRSAPPAAPADVVRAVPPAFAESELGDDELEQVVGGLERVFIPGVFAAD